MTWFLIAGGHVENLKQPKVYDIDASKGKAKVVHTVACPRCCGTGIFRPWGTCFRCGGNPWSRKVDVVYTEETLEKVRAKKAKRRAAVAEKKQQKERAEFQAFALANKELVVSLIKWWKEERTDVGHAYAFIVDMASMVTSRRPLTVKQAEAVKPALEKFYQNKLARAAKVEASSYLAAVGEKIEVELTVKIIRDMTSSFNGHISYVTMYIMETADGQSVKYIGAASGFQGVGGKLKVSAKVKKHEEYKGIKTTVITRPKVLEVITKADKWVEEN